MSLFDQIEQSVQPSGPRVYTVSQVTNRIKGWLDNDRVLQDLWLEGEVFNWRPATSGHIYVTLKDAAASLRCVLWRSTAQQLAYLPEGDGDAVLAHGKVSVYELSGQYQLYVDDLQPAGAGTLYVEFERLKAQLAQEGVFDRAKRPLPRFPRRVGVVTSPSGAVWRDIQNVLRRRYPLVEVILAPTLVQGEEAPAQIVAALQAVSQVPDVDVIILARGGGSIEDLWAFNDERVARALAAAPVPVVCGVGHETDVTIADYAADVRAPTPSAAAELVVPDRQELARQVADYRVRLLAGVQGILALRRRQLTNEARALRRLSPQSWIDRYRQRVDELSHAAQQAVAHAHALRREQVRGLNFRLGALDPHATLKRGYAIVWRLADRRVVSRVRQVVAGDRVVVQVSDGEFKSVVEDGTA